MKKRVCFTLVALACIFSFWAGSTLRGGGEEHITRCDCDDDAPQMKARIKTLERKLYLGQVRSYRVSGVLNCQVFDSKTLQREGPDPGELSTFNCFPDTYKWPACMGGTTSYPPICQSATKMRPPMTMCKSDRECPRFDVSKSSIVSTQLPPGVWKSGMFSVMHDQRPIWTDEIVDHLLAELAAGKDISVEVRNLTPTL